MKQDILKEKIEKIKKKKNKETKIASFNVKTENFEIVKNFLEKNEVSFSSVIDIYLEEIAEDIKKKN